MTVARVVLPLALCGAVSTLAALLIRHGRTGRHTGTQQAATTHPPKENPMTEPTDPFRIASAVWQDLCDYQPGAAAALTVQLKAMPEDWPLRVFGVGRPDAATALPPAAHGEVFDDMRPEIPPYAEHSFDECPACIEAEDNCRYHKGYATGHHEALQAELDAVKADPTITLKDFLQRQADHADATA